MKIITQSNSYEDFIKNEIEEQGFDYVEAQFLMGYEPAVVSGVWVWVLKGGEAVVPLPLQNNHVGSNSWSVSLHDSCNHISNRTSDLAATK